MSSSANEAQRLRVLLDLNLLDTEPEERFDRITRLAARLFGVPMACVSLVDRDRLWLKSRVGVSYAEMPSAQTFCAHAIRQDDMLVVRDALLDAEHADSPYVTGSPAVRFYAGQPLSVNGVYIGTLCLADSVPRDFSEEDRTLLRDLAAVVANEAAADALLVARERARRGEAALRALLDHLPDSVLLLDEEGRVLSCNPAAESLFGLPADALVGQAGARLLGLAATGLPPTGAPALRHAASITRGDGAVLAVEAALSALEIDGRRHVAASVRDSSAHQAQLAEARAAEERRRAYFRSATHELRTPMASILGFSELLLKREFDAVTGRELLGIIHKQASRLVALINQMLDLARIDAGGPEERQRSRLSLPALVAGAVAAAVPPARAADVAVEEEGTLPQLLANETRLRQALENILANAVQFSDPGTRIDVGLAPALRDGSAGAAVRIRDRGVGMTPEQQARLFEHFYRAGERPELEGNGLGMVLVREIVAFHGGAIEVASHPGAGTAVTLWLPAAEETA